ncbi:MAG: 2-hydroxyacyl-CoA dehydratase family protein [Armatimonadetes bacterium]|nr:2-hydroxyacyl-CoA dehydratase family protein [Armatimonadota bacterium]
MSKRIIYSCPFVPAEWIAAHGLEPSRIIPKMTSSGAPNGVCPYAQAFTEAIAEESDAAAIIFTTVCDQMRRISETAAARTFKPIFLMNVPHTWQNPGAHRLYRDELERLGRFLEKLSGTNPSGGDLTGIMSQYGEIRQQILDSRPNLTARQFSEMMAAFHHNPCCFGILMPKPTPQGSRNNLLPVALIGGPLTSEAFGIFDLIEQAGGYVALDGTETGERTLPAAFDRRSIAILRLSNILRLSKDDPLGTLADAYFGHIPDPFRRPNSEFFKWLKQMIDERGIRGIILRHYLWCDIWRAEAQRIADWAGLPFLELDAGDGGLEPSRTLFRLEAFMEVITQ